MLEDRTGPILVTGAAGFLGTHFLSRLTSEGVRSTAVDLFRPDEEPGSHHWVAPCNLLDRKAVRSVMKGVGTVVHLAGRAHARDRGSPTTQGVHRTANLSTTRILTEEAARAGVRKFLFMSSAAVVGNPPAGIVLDRTPLNPTSPYGISKRMAEETLAETCMRTGMTGYALRPPMVFGPGMKGNPLRILKLVRLGLPFPAATRNNRRSMVFVGNLISAMVALLAHPGAEGGEYFFSDGHPRSTAEFVTALGAAMGTRVLIVPFPLGVLKAGGRLGDFLGRGLPIPLTSEALNRLVGSFEISTDRFQETFDFVAPYSFDEGISQTVSWYLSEHPTGRFRPK